MARKLTTVLLVVAVMAGLAGCSLLFTPPPAGLVAAAEKYAEDVRALPGVKAAEATVREVDPKDRPGEWRVDLVVDADAADGLSTVPASIEAVDPPSDAELTVTVRFPPGAGLAPVAITDAGAADVERVAALRQLPFVARAGFYYGLDVQLVEGTQLAEAVAGVRASQVVSSSGVLVSLSYPIGEGLIEVSSTGPSDAMIGLIEDLADDPSVEHINAWEPSVQRALERPSIMVDTDDPSSVVTALTGLVEPSVEGRPRTAFRVGGGDESIRGFVGLPLGSAEPDDLPLPPAPPPVDPAVLAGQLGDDAVGVAEFLAATAASSGIPGTPEVFTTSCGGSETSSQAQGNLLLPVFEYANSAQPAYDAIVAAWEADGYEHTDQATGTSIYTTSQSRAVVELTIRGTSEGITISAMGECRG